MRLREWGGGIRKKTWKEGGRGREVIYVSSQRERREAKPVCCSLTVCLAQSGWADGATPERPSCFFSPFLGIAGPEGLSFIEDSDQRMVKGAAEQREEGRSAGLLPWVLT